MGLLKPKLDAVALGSGDVERKQSDLQAQWETLTGNGEGIEGPLNEFLGWVLDVTDSIGVMAEGLGGLAEEFSGLLGPINAVAGALDEGIPAATAHRFAWPHRRKQSWRSSRVPALPP